MPQQTDPAIPIRLSSITSQGPSQKVRVAGRLVGPYDSSSPFVEITDEQHSLIVDISLCIEPSRSSPWLREKHSLAMFIGYPEVVATSGGRTTVLRALIARETNDLQLSLWTRAIEEREKLAVGSLTP